MLNNNRSTQRDFRRHHTTFVRPSPGELLCVDTVFWHLATSCKHIYFLTFSQLVLSECPDKAWRWRSYCLFAQSAARRAASTHMEKRSFGRILQAATEHTKDGRLTCLLL